MPTAEEKWINDQMAEQAKIKDHVGAWKDKSDAEKRKFYADRVPISVKIGGAFGTNETAPVRKVPASDAITPEKPAAEPVLTQKQKDSADNFKAQQARFFPQVQDDSAQSDTGAPDARRKIAEKIQQSNGQK